MYGETGGLLRAELTVLLRQHRVQLALGGGSQTAATTTPADRDAYGQTIRRYRETILAWCSDALDAARPLAFTNIPKAHRANPFTGAPHDATPLIELQRALQVSRRASTSMAADLALLTTPHPNPAVEHWRQAARAAALAEHDFSGPDNVGRLSTPLAQALLGDIAAVVQALVVLDQRYANTPGWERLADSQRLGWTALACSLDVALGQPDYTIDQRGWRPRTRPLRGSARPGVVGVLQAEHNLLIRLQAFPSAISLRLIVDSQRVVSDGMAELVARVSPNRAERWTARTRVYSSLQHELRNFGGLVGKGGLAVTEASNATSRLRRLPADTIIEPRLIGTFQAVFDAIDERISDALEHGITRGAYLQRVPLPRLVSGSGQLVQPVRERFTVATSDSAPELLRIARTDLRPPHSDLEPQGRAGESRALLHTALVHRPPASRARSARSL